MLPNLWLLILALVLWISFHLSNQFFLSFEIPCFLLLITLCTSFTRMVLLTLLDILFWNFLFIFVILLPNPLQIPQHISNLLKCTIVITLLRSYKTPLHWWIFDRKSRSILIAHCILNIDLKIKTLLLFTLSQNRPITLQVLQRLDNLIEMSVGQAWL